ncbi:MAG: hypothetical protein L3K09_07815 [Thermoplasmata archaeon]|nr:hypothetical protein [Thermoplasmata archaeon]
MPEILTTWKGVYLLENGAILRSLECPDTDEALLERLRQRRLGQKTVEEERVLAETAEGSWATSDRRLVGPKVRYGPALARGTRPALPPLDVPRWRRLLLDEAERSLNASWDPSIHVEEAVRSMGDLDHTLNLVGERLVSWGSRDLLDASGSSEGSPKELAHRLAERQAPASDLLAPADPEIAEARRELARIYLELDSLRGDLERAIEGAMPRRAPNLCQLLGPLLTARLLSQAGGLSRMARLPASSIQVLGAERAFFEHLRGRAPPPRHGLLFLHPDVQGSPRRLRGKIARALAGKVAIAARLDEGGAALRPELLELFSSRTKEIRSLGVPKPSGGGKKGARSRAPLDRATEDG